MTTFERPLGRREPTDWKHVEQYPLSALADVPTGVPVVLGIAWHTAFDNPEMFDGRWWIGRVGELGNVRGGHSVCVPSAAQKDTWGWWDFYNQGANGACVGFASSRMMSLLNRRRYYARWLWDQAKTIDEWPDTNPGDDNGTSVRAALDVLRDRGHVRWSTRYTADTVAERDARAPAVAEGIAANRWATTVEQILEVLATPLYGQIEAVPILNSWGRVYPRKVWLPLTALAQLLRENGEAGLVTDR